MSGAAGRIIGTLNRRMSGAVSRWKGWRTRPVLSQVRVGTDIQDVVDVDDAVTAFGARYTGRLFTEQEIRVSAGSSERLAARFAAKEAVLKVLDAGDDTVDPREIEVVRQPSGRCTLSLSGEAARLARVRRLSQWDVSLSHTQSLATATVIAVSQE